MSNTYTVTTTVNFETLTKIRKEFKKNPALQGVEFTEVKHTPIESRADRLSEAENQAGSARDIVTELQDELQNWRDNLPENLQSSSKADELDEAISNLEEISNSLECADFSSVNFPSMM